MSSAGALAVGISVAGAGPVSADYGSGAQFQVEISANTPDVGFWIWAELGPNQTSDYEETDCIHLGLGPDGALNDAGSLSSWSVTNGSVTMDGMLILGGLETATVSAPIGPNGTINAVTITVTSAAIPNPPIPVGASLRLPAAGVVAP